MNRSQEIAFAAIKSLELLKLRKDDDLSSDEKSIKYNLTRALRPPEDRFEVIPVSDKSYWIVDKHIKMDHGDSKALKTMDSDVANAVCEILNRHVKPKPTEAFKA